MFAHFVSPATSTYLIEQSLRFNDDDSAYLYRTPSVAGNRKTFTFSCWVKLGNIGADWYTLFNGYTGSTSDTAWLSIAINVTGALNINGWTTSFRSSNALLRDPNAWYHIVVQCDSTNATANDRIKAWVNGTAVSWATNNTVTLNQDFGINSTGLHTLGRRCDSANDYFDGLMALPILVDGTALDYTSFAEFDGIYYGPKRYTGSYGTNGFALDFSNTSYYGKDVKDTYDAIGATYRGTYSSATNASSYTQSSATLGTADADRQVIVAIPVFNSTTNVTVSSVTVGGVSATQLDAETFYSGTSGNYTKSDFWKANVPTGTTGDIVVTFSGTSLHAGFSWWTCIGDVQILDNKNDTATDVTAKNSSSVTIQKPDNGFVLASVAANGSAGAPTQTWGGTGITEVNESAWGENDAMHGYASGDFTTASVGTVTSANGTGDQYYSIMSVLSFVPVNDNSFVSSGLATNDQLADSPTDKAATGIGNFNTINPLVGYANNGTYAVSNGNLTATTGALSSDRNAYLHTHEIPLTGKWYFEVTATRVGNVGGSWGYVGIARENENGTFLYGTNGQYKNDGSGWAAYGAVWADTNVIGVYVNQDDNEITFYVNNSSQGVKTITSESYRLTHSIQGDTSDTSQWDFNFGQQPFVYTPPTGAKAISTQNLPAPTINNPSEHFNTVLWTGDGNTTQAVTGVGFQPDFVWLKSRSAVTSHHLYDAVRGAEKQLASDGTGAEGSTGLTSFDSDGFTAKLSTGENTSSRTMVAWCWKANGSGSSNTDGTISSTVSANTTAGFSIISYTGNTTSGATVGHGLNEAPEFILVKDRDTAATSWGVYHASNTSAPETDFLELDATTATQDNVVAWNDTAPSSSVVTLGNGTRTNNTTNMIMYAWHGVEGFSAFGGYTGNADANGPLLYTGFKPAFVLVKRTDSTGSWGILDNTRSTYNPANDLLWPDLSNAEATSANYDIDFLANGFKLRSSDTQFNASGGTYIYAAFAEAPFQGGSKPIQQGRAA